MREPVAVESWAANGDPTSRVMGTATIRVGSVTIRAVRLVDGREGRFISFPARRLPDQTFLPYVQVTPDVEQAILAAILSASLRTADDGRPS